MKKKILGSIVAVAIAAIAAVNVNFNNEAENRLSALSLANVEALADGESGGPGNSPCYTGEYQSWVPVALKCSVGCDQYDRVVGRVDKC